MVDRGFDASDFGFVCEFFGFSCGSRKITDHDHIMPRNHPISLFKSCCPAYKTSVCNLTGAWLGCGGAGGV